MGASSRNQTCEITTPFRTIIIKRGVARAVKSDDRDKVRYYLTAKLQFKIKVSAIFVCKLSEGPKACQ